MTRLNSCLLTLLVLVGIIGAHLRGRANQMHDLATAIPQHIPQHDPRPVAAKLARALMTSERQIHKQLGKIAHLIELPESDGSSDQDPTVPSREEVDARVRQIFAGTIGLEEIAELEKLVDPKRHALPSHARIHYEAIQAWPVVRAKWDAPIGHGELSSHSRLGTPSNLVEQLDPRIPSHLQHVMSSLQRSSVDTETALRFLEKRPLPLFERNHRPTYAGVVAFSNKENRPSNQKLANLYSAWTRKRGREEGLSMETLSLLSHVNVPLLWEQIGRSASSTRHEQSLLERMHTHAVWHSARIDDAAAEVMDRLRVNSSFPKSRFALSDASDDPDPELDIDTLQMNASATILSWQKQFISATPQEQHAFYLRLLKIAPEDRLRTQMVAFAAGFKPRQQATKTLADALYCRWCNQEVFQLLRHATTVGRLRSSPGEPDATAEAIQTLCRDESPTTGEAAIFWIGQPRWPGQVTAAWVAGGKQAELALCEALLRMNVKQLPAGLQPALETLSQIGGTPTLVVLDVIQGHAAERNVRSAGLDRFARFCRLRVSRRLQAQEHGDQGD